MLWSIENEDLILFFWKEGLEVFYNEERIWGFFIVERKVCGFFMVGVSWYLKDVKSIY